MSTATIADKSFYEDAYRSFVPKISENLMKQSDKPKEYSSFLNVVENMLNQHISFLSKKDHVLPDENEVRKLFVEIVLKFFEKNWAQGYIQEKLNDDRSLKSYNEIQELTKLKMNFPFLATTKKKIDGRW